MYVLGVFDVDFVPFVVVFGRLWWVLVWVCVVWGGIGGGKVAILVYSKFGLRVKHVSVILCRISTTL